MLDKSLFYISQELVEKKAVLADGKEHTLHFKEIGSIEFSAIAVKLSSEDAIDRVQGMADMVVASLCNPDGTKALTLEEMPMMKHKVLTNLFNAAISVQKGSVEGKD